MQNGEARKDSQKKGPRGLTPKQERFVQEYLKDLNATQACIRAGYSAKTADRIGPELLGKTCVAAAIEKAKKSRSKRLDITLDRVLLELARVAFADTGKAVRVQDGMVIAEDTNSLDDDTRAAIAEISPTQNGPKVRLHDKVAALKIIKEHLSQERATDPDDEDGEKVQFYLPDNNRGGKS